VSGSKMTMHAGFATHIVDTAPHAKQKVAMCARCETVAITLRRLPTCMEHCLLASVLAHLQSYRQKAATVRHKRRIALSIGACVRIKIH
jgi:hypothetical protein